MAEGKVSAKDVDLFKVTDDVDEAVAIMVEARRDSERSRPGDVHHEVEPHRSE